MLRNPPVKASAKNQNHPHTPCFFTSCPPLRDDTCYRFGDPCTQQFQVFASVRIHKMENVKMQ